ncbi:MAG: hypothetical protein MJ157_00130 [Clostridia bacterium]|nr:hypothetical protein [Clostridia bacterium]
MAKKLGIAVLSLLLLLSVMPWAVAEQSCIVDVLCVDNNNQPLSGVVVESLRENNGTWQQETTNDAGKAYFEMENGNYSLTVNTAPDGYTAAQEKYQVLVKAGTPYLSNDSFSRTYDYETITFINEAESIKEPQRSFMVYVTDDADNPLASAKLTLQSKSKTYVTTTDEDGLATFLAINGRYTLSETEAPTGYKVSKNTYTVVLNNEDVFLDEENSLKAYSPITFVNPALPDELNTEVLYSVSAYVKSIDGKFLEGATLTLTSSQNTYSKFTNKQGMAEFKVPAGE